MHRLGGVARTGQSQLHWGKVGSVAIRDERLERLGRRADEEGNVDITSGGDDGAVPIDDRNRSVMPLFNDPGTLNRRQHDDQEIVMSASPRL